MTKLKSGLPFLALAFCLAQPAIAGDKEEAKQLFDAGLKLMKLEDFTAATANFERSTSLFPTQNSLFNLANCYQALRRYGDSIDTLERLRRDFGKVLKPEIQAAASHQEAELRSLAARLLIRITPSDANVSVDEKETGAGATRGPVWLSPGIHAIEATRLGYRPQRLMVQLVSGKEHVAALELETEARPAVVAVPRSPAVATLGNESARPLAPTQGRTWRIVAWTAAAGAVATGAMAGTFWYLADQQYDDYKRYNTGRPGDQQLRADAKTATQSAATVAIGCGIASIALAVTAGVTYWLGRDTTAVSTGGSNFSLSPTGLSVSF